MGRENDMERYTKKDQNGRYYIESVNGKLENDIKGHTYGEAIDRFAELENADVVPRSEVERLENELAKCYIELDKSTDFYCSFTKSKIQECPIQDEVEKAKQEVARELIKEFDGSLELLHQCANVAGNIMTYWETLKAELKKKYIGG